MFARLLLVMALTTGTAHAQSTANNPLAGLFLSNPAPLQARFVEVDKSSQTLTEGIFTVGAQGQIRWEQTVPYAQLVVVNGRSAWQVDQDLNQATRLPLQATEAWTALWRAIEPSTKAKLEILRREKDWLFLGKNQMMGVSFTVTLNSKGFPASIQTNESNFVLSDWKRLPGTPSLFDYQPSVGMDIIE